MEMKLFRVLVVIGMALATLIGCSPSSVPPPSKPVAYAILDFGAWWCGGCQHLQHDILENPAARSQLNPIYSTVISIDVDRQAADPAARLLMAEYKPAGGIPQLVVVALDQRLPDSMRISELTMPLAEFLVQHGYAQASKQGYASNDKSTYMAWLLEPTTQQQKRIFGKPTWRASDQEMLNAAFTLTEDFQFEEAKPYWKRIRDTKKVSLKADLRWSLVALRVGSRNEEADIAKKAADTLIRKHYSFDKRWVCDALKADPTLRPLAVRTYASGTVAIEQRRDLFDCAATSAQAEQNLVAAREYFRQAAELQRQIAGQDSQYLGERIMLGYYLAQYDLDESLRYLKELEREQPFVANSEMSDYFEAAERYDAAVTTRLTAIQNSQGVAVVKQMFSLAKDYHALGDDQKAMGTLDQAIQSLQGLVDSPEMNRKGNKGDGTAMKSAWEEWLDAIKKKKEEYSKEADGY